jgi:ABC-2 type transport system permease protein
MIGALLYLRLTSLQNLLRSRLQRLKQPKYLFGAIVGAAYFWFFVFRRMFFIPVGSTRHPPPELQALPLMLISLPVIVVGAKRVIEAWIAPDDKPGLAFTEAEVAFLFPAPMTRRMLVHFKLLGNQVTILISSLFFALLASRWVALGGNFLTHTIGFWVMFSTLNLHTTGAAFTVKRLIDGGVSKGRRQAGVIGVILLFLAVAAYAAWRTAPPPTPAESANPLAFVHYVAGLTDTGVLYWLALPFKIVLGPFLAPDWMEFLRALGPALLLLAAHYVWVVRTETSFEEASIAMAEKRTAQIAAMREGKYRFGQAQAKSRLAAFRLASAGGRPEVAFLWKNLLSTSAFFRPRSALIIAGLIIAGWTWLTAQPAHGGKLAIVAGIALLTAGYTIFLGPQLARQDLRSDLSHADILKSYPLHGWQVLLGELLTPTAILSTLLWLALLTVALSFHPRSLDWLTPQVRLVSAVGMALIIPVLCALQLLVPNAAAVLFPGWMHATRHRGERGIEMLGQRLIFVAGQLLVIVLALLPAALGVLGAYGLAYGLNYMMEGFIGPTATVALAVLAVLVILVAEVWCGLWWLGERFEKFDLSAELRP